MNKLKECDLVMKGGITSGIVYPSLVLRLKNRYRFRNIGGTSAGAISAAAVAAAEYGREQNGFDKLKDLQDQLSKGTFLRDLFQPSQTTRPLMNVLLDFISNRSLLQPPLTFWYKLFREIQNNQPVRALAYYLIFGYKRAEPSTPQSIWQFILQLTSSLWHHAPFISFVGALLGADLAYLLAFLMGGSVSAWRIIFLLLFAWLGALVAGVIYLGFILTRKVPENLLGICTGRKDDLDQEDPTVLTDWLNNWLNNLAGIAIRKEPLTFGDLRRPLLGEEDNITLRMVTSNLSQNLPYVLPFEEQIFLFKEDDFKKLFPKQILNYLKRFKNTEASVIAPPPGYYFFPEADDLPVIVATRMSLSFPVLLSAVPLYTIKPNKCADISAAIQKPVQLEPKDLQINWFSDGGICSNFPIHFFDTWLPKRPTFGVNLTSMPEEQVEEKDGKVKVKQDYISPTSTAFTSAACQVTTLPDEAIYLPKADELPVTEFIPLENELIENSSLPIPNLLRFIRAIFSTAQNYRDNAQSVLPSYRERIVQVRLKDDEGGLNLAMPEDTIKEVIKKGETAGSVLLYDFNFKYHQWVRFRILMKLMEASIYEMNEAIAKHEIYRDLVNNPEFDLTDYPYGLVDPDLLCNLATRLKNLNDHINAWQPPKLLAEECSPLPEPILRVMPKV
ncbi:patatin-like phospholipase family protein [Chlorogloeopsis sp. ULAP02]|uniref:patatin-like phospholipase family protein n=1 Tax=Chlorogloeopsis sp. ULAP02 TaxID=3107926 RepID=UPI00398B90C1